MPVSTMDTHTCGDTHTHTQGHIHTHTHTHADTLHTHTHTQCAISIQLQSPPVDSYLTNQLKQGEQGVITSLGDDDECEVSQLKLFICAVSTTLLSQI